MATVAENDPALASSRRPLKSRGWGWTQRTAAGLARSGVTPNAISLMSIVCAAVAAAGFVTARRSASPWVDAAGYLLAIVGIQSRLLCNLFDGMVAVEGGRRTPAGELFNETPDRVADTVILVAAGYAADPVYGPTLGWLAALLAMATAYVRVLGKACGAGTYFLGPMAKQQRMACVCVVCVGATLNRLPFLRTPTDERDYFSLALAIICLGCAVTLWRRLSCIAADLRAKGAA